MKGHLSENQLAEWMLGGCEEAVSQHLRVCDVCRTEAEGLRQSVSQLRDAIHAAAEQRRVAWKEPWSASAQHVWGSRRYPSFRWAYVAATAVIVLVAALRLTRAPQPQPHAGNDVADATLLLEVQSAVHREAPVALAPAELLADEIDRNLTTEGQAEMPQRIEKERRARK
jgi:hypothetical protein